LKKVLISNYVHKHLITGLQNQGYEVIYDKNITLEQLKRDISEYSGIIINSKIKADQEFLQKADKLEFIGRLGSGLEIIDLVEAKKRNIAVFNSPEGNRNAVAEHAIGMLLNLFNNISTANNEVKSGIWSREKNRGIELSGKTLGIIGYGNTGSTVAKKLQGWNVSVLAYDKYKTGFASDYSWVEECEMDKIYEQADILSLHVQLTQETKFMVNYNFIQKFQKPFYLINTSRGKMVVLSDLIKTIKEKKILGACLDVLPNEKLSSYLTEEKNQLKSLSNLNNVILTPHIAGWTKESLFKIANTLLNKILTLNSPQN